VDAAAGPTKKNEREQSEVHLKWLPSHVAGGLGHGIWVHTALLLERSPMCQKIPHGLLERRTQILGFALRDVRNSTPTTPILVPEDGIRQVPK
jgi:hypothetical protein